MAWETELQIIIAAATNLTLVPAVFYAYRRKQSFNFIICLAALITSIMYHTCDAWEHQSWANPKIIHKSKVTILGMDAGSWHRLDNVFAILMAQSMFLFFADFKAATTNDAVRWLCLTICLFFQELAPWNLLCTVIPILFAAAIMLSKYVFTQQLPTFDKLNLFLGSFSCLIGIIFFHRGLDDDNDWLRINHSIWHAMAGMATYFWYKCKAELEYRNSAKIM